VRGEAGGIAYGAAEVVLERLTGQLRGLAWSMDAASAGKLWLRDRAGRIEASIFAYGPLPRAAASAMRTYSRPASMITRSKTTFHTINAHRIHSQVAIRRRLNVAIVHRRLAYALSATTTTAIPATIHVTAGGVPLGDERASTAATAASTTSAMKVTMKLAREPRERCRSVAGG